MRHHHLMRVACVAGCLLSTIAGPVRAKDGAGTPRRVYFAAGGIPFMAVYRGQGFEPIAGDDIEAVLKAWEPALRARRTFPGLSEDGRKVKVTVRAVRPRTGDVGEQPFDTDGPALFWSVPDLEVRAVPLRPVPLRTLDAALIQREAVARGKAWARFKGTSGEGNPNPPHILDPALRGNLRISAAAPRDGTDLVLVRVELFAVLDETGERYALEEPLLLLYSRAAHAVLGSLALASPRLRAFEIAGDPAVYLLYDGGGYECAGTTILPMDRIPEANLFPTPAVQVWCS